jgi:hypothetical protein
MEAKNLGYREVAAQVEWSPEHIRKLCASEAFPSKPLRNALADLLEIDRVEFERQVNADHWRKKFGKIPTVTQTQHPIQAIWDELTEDQQVSVLCMARCLAKRKKRRAS